jgi:hypothetical protein
MSSKLNILITLSVAGLILSGFSFSRAIEENGKSYIVDLHGERWDVTQAKSIGFDPEVFRHGIGRNALTPLDDTHLKDHSRDLADSTRVIGIAGGEEARAYSVPRLYRHEVANSHIGRQPIAAAYWPLVDLAAVYSREIDGRTLTLVPSGWTYERTFVLYDRETDSFTDLLWLDRYAFHLP